MINIPVIGVNRMDKQANELLDPLMIKCTPSSHRKVHWESDPVLKKFFENGVDTQDKKLRHLISELDRRFCQLWDKVGYEQVKSANNLTQ
tara:strand:+ start:265 stop:534 length:270 start_codon:yes stop_codon:yes gene_type:complete